MAPGGLMLMGSRKRRAGSGTDVLRPFRDVLRVVLVMIQRGAPNS
jgi:hypothetical protein